MSSLCLLSFCYFWLYLFTLRFCFAFLILIIFILCFTSLYLFPINFLDSDFFIALLLSMRCTCPTHPICLLISQYFSYSSLMFLFSTFRPFSPVADFTHVTICISSLFVNFVSTFRMRITLLV